MADGVHRALGLVWRAAFVGVTAVSAISFGAQHAGASPCDQATISWDGGAGTTAWGTAANWTGDRLPNTNDHVCIPAGTPGATVSHAASTSIQSIEAQKPLTIGGSLTLKSATVSSVMSGGTLNGSITGPGTLVVQGTVDWTFGQMTGGAVTEIAPGGRVNIVGSCCSTWTAGSNATLVNNGTLHFSGGNGVYLGTNFKLDNNGTLEIASAGSITFHDNSPSGTVKPLITNTGTIVSTVSGDRSIRVPVWNKTGGVVKSIIGTISLYGGSGATPSSGTFAGGVVLHDTYPLSNATFTGTGNRLAGTVVIAPGSTTTVASGSTSLTGSLTGPGRLLVQGTLDWTFGQMTGAAVTEIAPGGRLNMVGPSTGTWTAGSNATVVNNGTLHFSGGNGLSLGTNFKIDNNATYEIASTGSSALHDVSATGTVGPLVTNTGTIVSTVSGDRSIRVPVWNKAGGVIRSDAGTISLYNGSGGYASSGTFAGGVVLYATTHLGDATFTGTGNRLAGTVVIAPGSTTTVASGSTATLSNTLEGPGRLLVRGTLEWAGALRNTASLYVASEGRVNMTLPSCCGRRVLGSDATVVNDGVLSITGSQPLSFGDALEVYNNGRMEWSPSSGVVYDDSTTTKPLIANSGTFVKQGTSSGTIHVPFENDGTLEVEAGVLGLYGRFRSFIRTRNVLAEGEYVLKGTLRVPGLDLVRNAARITLDGPNALFTDDSSTDGLRRLARNAGGGRLTLKNGATLSTLGAVRNDGKVVVESGSTFTTPGYTQTKGATVVEANGTLVAGTTPGMSIAGGSLRGSGTVQGHVTNSGGSVMPGTTTTPGSLGIQGNFIQTSNGTLDLDIAAVGSSDALVVTGAATLDGRLNLLTAATYVPTMGDVFTLLTYASRAGSFASTAGLQLPGGLAYSLQLQPQSATAVVQ